MTLAETTSLILTLLSHDDAQTARELAATLGTTPRALRPALCHLIASEDVVISGRAGGTRYLVAAEPAEQPVQAVELVVTATVVAQRAERSSTASLVLAGETPATPRPARKPRTARPVIPATVDIESALQATQQRLENGATLAELSARPLPQPAPARIVIAEIAAEVDALAPAASPEVACARCRARMCHECVCPSPLHRECSTPAEDVVARKLALQQTEAWGEAHDRATERRESRQHLTMGIVSALMVLAPVAWVVAHLVR